MSKVVNKETSVKEKKPEVSIDSIKELVKKFKNLGF